MTRKFKIARCRQIEAKDAEIERHRRSAITEMERARAVLGHNESLAVDLTNAIRWARLVEAQIPPDVRERLLAAFEASICAPKVKYRVKAGSRRVPTGDDSIEAVLKALRDAMPGRQSGEPDRGPK